MYSPRHSPLPHPRQDHGVAADRDGSSSRSSSASGSAASGTRSPSRSARGLRGSSRPDVSTSLPMETIQSLNAAYNAGPIYMGDGPGSPVHGRSSPVSSGGASGKSNSLSPRNSPTPSHDSHSSSLGSSQGLHGSPLTGSDGAEPHHHHHHADQLNNSNSTHHHPHPEDLRPLQDATMLDVHSQLREYQHENASLKQELDAKEAKLASSMNSIKTFWSPELKKERALRKEEAMRIQALREQCRTSVEENQNYCQDLKQMQEDLQQQREFNAQLQASLSTHAAASSGAHHHPHHRELDGLRSERDRLSKEVFLLRKTLEEMEIRIETQKQTLAARDESVKKLLEMLQSKGLSTKHLELERQEADRLRSKVVEAESRILQLETMLDQRDRERSRLADELRQSAAQAGWFEQQLTHTVLQSDDSVHTNLVRSLCETAKTKEDRIASLESQVRDYEHELRRVRSLGSLSPEERTSQQREINDYKSHSKLLKNQVDQFKLELSKKSSEVQALQTKIETLTHQQQDYQAHISLLKESLAAKEQHSSILQTDVEALRARLDEKEMTIIRKEQLLSTLSSDKTKRYSEVAELKEMLDIKERKIGVLQRKLSDLTNAMDIKDKKQYILQIKIDNLQEQLQEKDEQYQQLRARLSSAQADQTSSDSAMSSLEDALMEKDKTLEKVKEQRETARREQEEELQAHQKQLKEAKGRLETLQKELCEKEATLMDLKEHASTLASSSLKKDSKITTLELAVAQKTEEGARLETDLKKLREERDDEERRAAKAMEETIARHKEEIAKTQNEVDRLLEIMKEMEEEKNDKDKRVIELETQLKDATKRLSGVKRDQQLQKRKNAQLLEEARRREGELSTDTHQLQTFVRQRDDRIEELEEALKESVSITADREMILAQQTQTISNLQRQIDNLKRELEQVKKQLSTASGKLSTTSTTLRDKEAKLSALQMERRKTLEEAMEMKQEAITAAIGEKDAHIALLELNFKNPKACDELKILKKEKDALVQILKDETQRRIKFIHNDLENPFALEQSPITPEQDEEDGIWA